MKKIVAFLLTLLMLTASCVVFAEDVDENEVNEQDIVTADELTAAMSAEDEDAAFISWAKACTAIIVAMRDAGYNCAVGTYNYATAEGYDDKTANVEVLKAMMQAEDMWQVTVSIPRNSKDEGTFTNLNNAVIGYKNLQGYDSTLTALVALKPTVPEKYSKVASLIETAASQLHDCCAAVDMWISSSSSSSTMSLWGKMESLYWHDSVNTLAGLYYMDSCMGN